MDVGGVHNETDNDVEEDEDNVRSDVQSEDRVGGQSVASHQNSMARMSQGLADNNQSSSDFHPMQSRQGQQQQPQGRANYGAMQ